MKNVHTVFYPLFSNFRFKNEQEVKIKYDYFITNYNLQSFFKEKRFSAKVQDPDLSLFFVTFY